MTLYLIRHGKTEANQRRLYCGSTDLPLCEKGILELQRLNYQLPKNIRCITSGMKRTEQTLQILLGEVVHEQDPRFREVNFGIFEMHSYDELKDTADYQTWLSGDNDANIPPQGESGVQMRHRVMEAISELQTDTLIVTHGGVIAAIMENRFPGENKNRYEWQPPNGCGYILSDNHYEPIPKND